MSCRPSSVNCDIKVARLAGSNQACPYYKHWPSLVRHRHEVPSVCDHGVITTDGWDKDFRCRNRLAIRFEHLAAHDDHIRTAHLPRLRTLAGQCRTVVEFGTRCGGSTTALLAVLRRYIAVHDTHREIFDAENDGPATRRAVEEFAARHGCTVTADYPEDFGMMVLGSECPGQSQLAIGISGRERC